MSNFNVHKAAVEQFKVDQKVQWRWLGRLISGVVKEVFYSEVTREIKGKKIKRNGSPTKPAYLVQSDAGNLALKLHSELTSATKTNKTNKRQPTMF